MAYSLPSILHPKVINGTFQTLSVRNTTLQRIMGLNIGGPASVPKGGTHFSYDIVNPTRDIATARPHGQQSYNVQPKVIGHVAGRYPRSAETIDLDLNYLEHLRVIGRGPSEVDDAGAAYITLNETQLLQRFANLREFQVAAMLRGAYYWQTTGDDKIDHSFTSGGASHTVDFQIPAGNKTQLDMTGEGDALLVDWDTATNDILSDCIRVQKYFEQVSGLPVTNLLCSAEVAGWMLQNNSLRNVAGSAGPPFREFRSEMNDMFITFAALPWLKVWVINEVLNVAGTVTRLIPDRTAIFFPDHSPEWLQYWEGSEVVVEKDRAVQAKRMGLYGWSTVQEDPARIEIKAVHSGLPILLNPKAIAVGTIPTA